MNVSSRATALSCRWESYPWKNEIALQADRVREHFAEAADDDFEGDHHPLHMMERALALAAFSIRRMIEKRLVTDALADELLVIPCFPVAECFRPPFVSQSGGTVFRNYNFDRPSTLELKLMQLANEIIHSSQLLLLTNAGRIDDGLLVASDFGLKKRLLHIPLRLFDEFVARILHDHVSFASDDWNPLTGEVTAIRE